MSNTHTDERVFGLNMNSRPFALLWAFPFIIFAAFPYYGSYLYGLHRPLAIAMVFSTTGFVVTYLVSWLINPTPPHPGRTPSIFWVIQGLLVGIQVIAAVLTFLMGGTGSIHMLGFVAATWTLQAPRRLIPHGLIALLLLSLAEHVAFEGGIFLPFGLLAAGFSTVMSRLAIDAGIRQEARSAQLLALARERERDRISADLHDILGHTLTGMTIKADLVKRLLEKDRPQEAHTQVSELLELSRSALAEVRAVVADNRQLNLDEEITSAATLLAASGVDLQVHWEGRPPIGVASSLVARVIREGTTNIVVHSKASRAVLTISHNGAELRNNGYHESYSRKTRGAGSGLHSLADKASEYGSLSWGREGNWWLLTLHLDEVASLPGAPSAPGAPSMSPVPSAPSSPSFLSAFSTLAPSSAPSLSVPPSSSASPEHLEATP